MIGVCPALAPPPPKSPVTDPMGSKGLMLLKLGIPPPLTLPFILFSVASMLNSSWPYVRYGPPCSMAWMKENVAAPVETLPDRAEVSAAVWLSRAAPNWIASPPLVPCANHIKQFVLARKLCTHTAFHSIGMYVAFAMYTGNCKCILLTSCRCSASMFAELYSGKEMPMLPKQTKAVLIKTNWECAVRVITTTMAYTYKLSVHIHACTTLHTAVP